MKVEKCSPGYTKKAVTFTIDDGNLKWDKRFLSILSPAGIKGTFNLCSDRIKTGEEEKYREFYRGYEISNHVKFHPYVFRDDTEYMLDKKGEPFDHDTSDKSYVYPVEGKTGFYWRWIGRGWRQYVSSSDYIKYTELGRAELERVFGQGQIGGYVWPYGMQMSSAVQNYLLGAGYYGLRATGCVKDSTGFALPADRMSWSYNANHTDLLEVMSAYDAYPDDGELKFFSLGVHSVDFENNSKWDDLAEFAKLYGSRPKDFWYASVGEIFAYADACELIKINESARSITNNSDVTVYLKVDGEPVELLSGFTVVCS